MEKGRDGVRLVDKRYGPIALVAKDGHGKLSFLDGYFFILPVAQAFDSGI